MATSEFTVKFQQIGADNVANGANKIGNALNNLSSVNVRSAMREQVNLQRQLLSVSERRKTLEDKIQKLQNEGINKATKNTQEILTTINKQKESLIKDSIDLRNQLKNIVDSKNKINTEVLKKLNFSIGKGVGSYTVNFADKLEDYIKKIPNLSLQKEKNRLKDFLLDNKKITQKDLKNFSNYLLPLDFKAKNGSIRTISTSEQINLIRSWLKGSKIYSSNGSTPLQERVKNLITDNVVGEIFKSYINPNLKPGEIGFQSVDSLKTAFNDFLNTGKTTKALGFLLQEKGFISSFKDTEKEKILNHLTKFKETGIITPELKDIITNMFSSPLKTDEENNIIKRLKENSNKINELTKQENKTYKNIPKAERLESMQKKLQELQSNETELAEKVKSSQANIPKEIENLKNNVVGKLNSQWMTEQLDKISKGKILSSRELRNIKGQMRGTIREANSFFSALGLPVNLNATTQKEFDTLLENYRDSENKGFTQAQKDNLNKIFKTATDYVDRRDRVFGKTIKTGESKSVDVGEFSGFKRNHPYGVGYLNYGFPTVSQKQIEFQQRQQEINNANMSLYATSHAMKAIEGTLQQGYEVGKGNIDEYVRFQSATVGVAKLLPVLRDKDTLLVNERFNEFRQGILDMTENLPRSGVELAQASEVAARLGVTNPDQIRKVVEAGTKLGVAFGMAPNEVTNNIVKIANAKGIDINKSGSMEKIMEFADAINYLDDHTAASGREIINFTKKAVQTAEGVKMDTKDVSAFGASLVSLGISSDQANTAFKNLMTVLQTGARNRKTGNEYLEKSGYTVKQLTTEFKKNPTKTAVEFIKRLNKLRSAPAGSDAAAIVRFAFGQMSAQGIMALVNNPEVLEKYLKMARSDSLNWTEKEFQARQKNDPAVQFKLLDNAVKKLQIDTGEMLMPIAQAFINDIKSFTKQISPAVKEHGDILRTGAYAGLGLLGLTKVGGFITDTAMLSNNLRNFKWYNDFVKSKYKTNKLSYNAPMILTNGELVNGGWNKGVSVKNNRNLWNRFSFRAGVYGGKKEFLQLYRQFGKMRNDPTMYSNGKAIGDLAKVTKEMNAMKWKGGLQAGLALLPTLFSVPVLAGLAGIGTASYLTYNYVNKQINKKDVQRSVKANAIKGTTKDIKRRYTAQHSNVFQTRKLNDLLFRLNKQGYTIDRDENGQLVISSGKLIKNEETKKYEFVKNKKVSEHFSKNPLNKNYMDFRSTGLSTHWIKDNGKYITENKNPELFSLFDEIKRINYSIKATEARQGFRPQIELNNGQIIRTDTKQPLNYQDPTTGEMINYVHPTNYNAWNWLGTEQRRASKIATKQAEEKQKLLKKQKKAEEEGNIEEFYSATNMLNTLRKEIISTEAYEKKLRQQGAETDWEEENGFNIYKFAPKHSLENKINKSIDKNYKKQLQQYGLDKFDNPDLALQLAERLEQQEYWNKMRTNLGYAKQNKDKGIKDFYGTSFVYDNDKLNPLGVNGYQQANDTLYRLNQEIIQLKAKLSEQSKDVKPLEQMKNDKINNFTNAPSIEYISNLLTPQQKEILGNLEKQESLTKKIPDNYNIIKTKSVEAFNSINDGAVKSNSQITNINSSLQTLDTTLSKLTSGNHVIKVSFSVGSLGIPNLIPNSNNGDSGVDDYNDYQPNKKGKKR